MPRDIGRLSVRAGDPVRTAITRIDEGRCAIALVLDDDGHLMGTITDGDIRRALLAGQDMEAPVAAFLAAKSASAPTAPVTAPLAADRDTLLALMTSQFVRQIPLVDAEGRVVDLTVLEDVLPAASAPAMRAVIMAGGRGSRLRPLTEDLPKPMLPIGGRPLMEHIIRQLQQSGIRHVKVTTHYKPERIREHFGDGSEFGVVLQYVNEEQPLGTGGALGLMDAPAETQLVVNGDILTEMDFRAMLEFHQDHRAEMTVAVRQYALQVPYGVVECDATRITGLKEKPQVVFLVNAGVYLLEPSVHELIPSGKSFNMTDLIRWLLDAGRLVISFPIREYWMDVGQHQDYTQAQADVERGRVKQ
jgi:dTDP-glucose pyrophosphorylase